MLRGALKPRLVPRPRVQGLRLTSTTTEAAAQAQQAAQQASQQAARAAQSTQAAAKAGARRFKSFVWSSVLLLGTGAFLVYAHDSRAGVWRWVVVPTLMALTADDPERAHEMAVDFVASGLAPVDCGVDDDALAVEVWGRQFSNPLGMAAGWDKHAAAIDGLFNLGFGYVEVGSATPEPQPGNPRPRLFRVPELEAVVNRYGFNSEGHANVLDRLRDRLRRFVTQHSGALPPSLFPETPADAGPGYDPVNELLSSPAGSDAHMVDELGLPRSLAEGRVLGVNLGKNKSSDPDSIDDFVVGIKTLGPYADVLVVNVSSPNTPGLRNLQRKGILTELLQGVVAARNELGSTVKPPVLVKIAPDNDEEQLNDIAAAVLESKIDGIIVSNTTISRPENVDVPYLSETGGLSGPPVKPLALKALNTLYEATDGKVPLVGCGGISSGQDAVDFAKAGASLVQLYTSFIYGGVGLPRRIKDEISDILQSERKTWSQIVGSARPKKVAVVANKAESALEQKKEQDGKEQISPMTGDQFKASLAEAKSELEDLLAQLAAFDSHQVQSKNEPATQPTMDTQSATSKTVSGVDDVDMPAAASSRLPRIDESPLAVPPQALLGDKEIAALLDVGKAQVDAGLQQPEKQGQEKAKEQVAEAFGQVKDKAQETKDKVSEGPRWV
ncbi:Dihydroorotate dehydrogenase (quinone), mitochondrial [Microbotryomycetes sp. JL201]|nr:Dihydroorotate dehydrogenase (quinone), mitochondrial [Microbotryomycetes sp. JL201]KAK4049193.1 Dihydroorotate dehydrogenase (quinone), mitochondrial [Microbotryomycetes sp. JL201]